MYTIIKHINSLTNTLLLYFLITTIPNIIRINNRGTISNFNIIADQNKELIAANCAEKICTLRSISLFLNLGATDTNNIGATEKKAKN